MTNRILLFGLIMAGLSSCATYRTGQTPDDVYYSPQRTYQSYVQTDRDEDNRVSYNERQLEDQRLRQQIRDSRFRSFDDDIFWGSPRYNSWGWNTWNNPYNTWGWNNSFGTNYGWGSYRSFNNFGWNSWNTPYVCIPSGNNVLVIAGPGAPKNASGVRYSPPMQSFNTTSGANGKTFSGSGSRYFGGNSNSSGTRRTGFFSGGNTNSGSWNSGNSGSSSGGSRTFSSGNSGGSSGGSSSGSSNSKSSSSGRRN